MKRFGNTLRILLAGLVILLTALFLSVRFRQMMPADREAAAMQTAAPAETQPAPTAVEIAVEPTLPAAEPQPEAGQEQQDVVPRYFQTDYPYIKYGNGTIATSGCSITCLAMVASYLTEQEYTPEQFAYHFGSYGKNNIERLEYGNETLGLPCVAGADWRTTVEALQAGKVAIAMVDERSDFTNEQHFIVLAGITQDGKILVNDPIEPNYSLSHLKAGFESGFEAHQVVKGFEGAWIYDRNALPEDFVPFDAQKPAQQENRYDGYELTDEDNYTLACYAWAVAREEPEQVQQAVLEVILNRVTAEGFPNTVKEVIDQSDLYDARKSMDRAAPDFPQYRAVTAAMYGPYVLPKEVLHYSQWNKEGDVWGQLGSFTFLYSR